MTVGGSCSVPLHSTQCHSLFHPFKSHPTTSLVPPTLTISYLTSLIQAYQTKKAHVGQQISQNPLHPHDSTVDCLFTWDMPHAACHRQHLTASLPPDLVNSAMMSICGAYASNTKTTYAAGTLHFTQFCDTRGIDEEA